MTIEEKFDAGTYHSSKYLKAFHLMGRGPRVVTVTKVTIGKYNDDDDDVHVFLNLDKFDRLLGLGNPLVERMSAMFGRDIRRWKGKTVTLVVEKLENGINAIRIHEGMDEVSGEELTNGDGDEDFDPLASTPRKKKRVRPKRTGVGRPAKRKRRVRD